MKRRGAVLLMTLFLITVMSGAISLLLGESDHLLHLSKRSHGDAQITKISSDLQRLLPQILSRINTVNELEYALILPFSSRSSDERFMLEASLHSPYRLFNINTICDPSGKTKEPYIMFVSRIFERYPIASPNMFLNILLDTIDMDLEQRQEGSEILASFPDFHNGSIENFTQFEQVIARYLTLTKDSQILDIPWKQLIGFEGEKIDINYVSPEVLSLIAPELDSQTVHRITDLRTQPFESKEQLLSIAPELSSVYDTWFFLYTSGSAYSLIGEVAMQTDQETNSFRFHIDTLNRKLNHLEIIE
jgi:hypothetical protein